MVGVTGIEPVTPTMSTLGAAGKQRKPAPVRAVSPGFEAATDAPGGLDGPSAYSQRTDADVPADGADEPLASSGASGEVAAFYASLGDGEQAALREADARINSAEGADASTTFQKGEALAAARDAVDPGTFSRWCAVRWAFHRTYAYSFMRVAERLAAHRDRLVEARVDRSTLMALASRPERAEALLAAFGGGRRPTFAEAKSLIAGDGSDAEAGAGGRTPEDVGGPRGLALLHAAKRRHVRDLAERLERIIAAVEAALAAPRVLKGELAAAINQEARWAQAELYSLCAFLEPASWDSTKPVPVPFRKDSGWDRAVRLLYELGGDEHWPPRQGMESWLRATVLPVLYWAARGDGPAPAAVSAGAPVRSGDGEQAAAGAAAPDPADGPDSSTIAFPLDDVSARNCAAFLAFIRRRYLEEGIPAPKVEETCVKVSGSLAALAGRGLRPNDPPPAAEALDGLARSLYRRSRTVSPIDPSASARRPMPPDGASLETDARAASAVGALTRRLVAAAAEA